MDRHWYLTHIWKPYPAMPQACVVSGRVEKLEADKLWIAGQSYSRTGPASEHLVEGDIVAVLASGVELLTPNMREWDFRPLQKKSEIKQWNAFVKQVRQWFEDQDFLEIHTPTLVNNPGPEPTIDVFETQYRQARNATKKFLPTSPELHLKRALVAGYERIFEIKSCFRNAEHSSLHQPEFFMLEWYRAYMDLNAIKKDLMEMIRVLANQNIDFVSKSVAELFQQYLDFKLSPATTAQDLKPLAKQHGLVLPVDSSFDDYFHGLWVAAVEPKLNEYKYVFVENYPPSQCALARVSAEGWGERFELYAQGVELCNAFHELNDPVEQRRRMRSDLDLKKLQQNVEIPEDEDFLQSLEQGLPPSAGVALGLDRLYLVLHNKTDIREFRLFPY